MIHFLTMRMEPVNASAPTLWPRDVPKTSSLVIITVFYDWGVEQYDITPWGNTEEELKKLADSPKEFVLWALKHMDDENADMIDGMLHDAEEPISINGKEVKIEW